MNTLTIKTPFGWYKNCIANISKYRYDDTLAISFYNYEDGPICNLTVCIDHGRTLADNQAFVDTNNCPWAIQFIRENKLGREVRENEEPVLCASGYCIYPLFEFDLEELSKYTEGGAA